jgi:hypothetical protein
MKKLLIIVSLIFVGTAVNAQWFMGARFNINADQTRDDDGTKRKTDASIGIYADIGYELTDSWDIGVDYGGTLGFIKNHSADTKTNTANWLLSPYARYSLFQAGNFELLGKGSLILEGSKTYYQVGLQAVPVLAYHLNERIALQANLNFFSFGVSYNKIKKGDARTNFNLGGNTNNVATLGGLTIGFLIKL